MLAKALTVVKSKVALAVLGVILVGGSGGAVAAAAHSGQLHGLGLQLGAAHGDSSGSSQGKSDDRAHAEGLLTACDPSTGAISVKDAQGVTHAFIVTSTTRFEGDIHSAQDASHGKSDGKGASTVQAGSGSAAAANATFTLNDLCKLVNTIDVQVQATASTSGSTTAYDATKVTAQGAPGASDDSKAEPTEQPQATPNASNE